MCRGGKRQSRGYIGRAHVSLRCEKFRRNIVNIPEEKQLVFTLSESQFLEGEETRRFVITNSVVLRNLTPLALIYWDAVYRDIGDSCRARQRTRLFIRVYAK